MNKTVSIFKDSVIKNLCPKPIYRSAPVLTVSAPLTEG